MSDTKKVRSRGRPRQFDRDAAIVTAQRLFHARGYDAVSVADVTETLGIAAPSFYAAFGSKAGLYARALEHWSETGAIPIHNILDRDRPVAEALGFLLEEAARRYAADPSAAGCLVLEGTRSNDADARAAALSYNQAAETVIRDYIAGRHPEEAARLADFVSTTMSGMSAKARSGHDLERLLATAHVATLAIEHALSKSGNPPR